MNCPNCGADDTLEGWGSTRTFRCGSTFYKERPCTTSDACRDRQIAQLKGELETSTARLSALLSEQKMINSATRDAYNRVKGDLEFAESQLSQSVRRDDLRLKKQVKEFHHE